MKKFIPVIFMFLMISAQANLIIQEMELGVCTMDGIVDSTSNATPGSTGSGLANIDNGLGIGMSWSFNVSIAGTYKLVWRYALGGSDSTSRDGALLVDNENIDTILFPHTGLWTNWVATDTVSIYFEAGDHKVRLTSTTVKGLANIDYFEVVGDGLTPTQCTPSYVFNLQVNINEAGSVDYTPKQDYYDAGDTITLSATANSGYFFHSWSGEEAGTDENLKITIKQNTYITALFYKDGVTMAEGANGYAVVQHDNGTPYLLTGGYLGDTVEVDNVDDLKFYLLEPEPYVVVLKAHITNDLANSIRIGSNKTLIGGSSNAHFDGVNLSIQNVRNVIVKDITFSKVLAGDLIEINSNAKNIWIDHCEFFTDRDHDDLEDYYDGMLDIKNESSFITVSWSYFHDHRKGILICSGDQNTFDSIQRITFHHNYFYNCGSRLPSIRFGKSHIYNNYYEDCETAVNSRMGACVQVEKNYFLNAGTGVGMMYSDEPGAVELIDNIFENTTYSDTPACELDVPYDYYAILNEPGELETIVKPNAGRIVGIKSQNMPLYGLRLIPNPAKQKVLVHIKKYSDNPVIVSVYDIMGVMVKAHIVENQNILSGSFELNLQNLSKGIYFIKVSQDGYDIMERLVVN